MRLFVAIVLPGAVKKALGSLSDDLAVPGTKVRWVRPDNTHLTLRFLGEVEETKVRAIQEASLSAAAGVKPFELTVEGVGAFPSLKKPRVIWVGVGRSAPLAALHGKLEDEFSRIGFPPEKKSWNPHLTIGRVKENWNLSSLEHKLSSAGFSPRTFPVDVLFLIKSDLRPEGPLYTRLKEIPLALDPSAAC